MRFYHKLLVSAVTMTIFLVLFSTVHQTWNTLKRTANSPRNYSFKEDFISLEDSTGNIPEVYVVENNNEKKPQYNNTCAKFPELFKIKFINDYWQSQKTFNGNLHLLNAYLDHRINGAIRIITMYNVYSSNDIFYCQVWYDEETPVIVKSEKVLWGWYKEWGGNYSGMFHPYIITCPTSEEKIPKSVSIVDTPCDNATNNLRINVKQGYAFDKRNFVVCVKGLDFPDEDATPRIVEWIELLFLLGVDKINFYKFNAHKTIEKVLDFYVRNKNVEVTPITLMGGVSNLPYWQHRYLHDRLTSACLYEIISFNDCLYKHLQEYKFVVILDTDEVIVPKTGSWNNLMRSIQEEEKSSYIARNVYFLDNHQHNHSWFEGVPRFMHMLQHVYRAQNYTPYGYFVKGFHDTRKVEFLYHHYPFSCLGSCNNKDIDVELAHLQHYRKDCSAGVANCDIMKNNSVVDDRVWGFKDQLVENVIHVLSELNLLDSS